MRLEPAFSVIRRHNAAKIFIEKVFMDTPEVQAAAEKKRIMEFLRKENQPTRIEKISGAVKLPLNETIRYVDILVREGLLQDIPLASRSAGEPLFQQLVSRAAAQL
jgi:hypothetical protein